MLIGPALKFVDNPILRQLHESKFEFFLTGSHYIGGAGEASDLDLLTEDNEEVRVYLNTIGFSSDILLNWHGYLICPHKGSETNAVVELRNVQVQLCRDVALQCNVRDIIRNYLFTVHYTADYPERRAIWDNVAALLRDPTKGAVTTTTIGV